MRTNELGKTGIKVTELCYGALPIGPLQADFTVARAAPVIRHSLESGINFIDTAQRYGTYPHIRAALKGFDKPVVIASKAWAETWDDMAAAVEEARQALDRDVIDLFHLHAARADETIFAKRRGALDYLCEAKVKGLIRATGISSHSVKAICAAADEPDIDVVFPLLNMLSLGILDGKREEMWYATAACAAHGKGVYIMKAMAGGHLADRYQEAFEYVKNVPGCNSIAVGMMSNAEIDANIAYFEDREPSDEVKALIGKNNKRLFVMDACKACGACVEHCPNGALSIVENRAVSDPEKCLLCGYCVPHCPQFAIRIVAKQ